MTLRELQDELTKRGAVMMMAFSMDRDRRYHVTFTECEKTSDSREARPSERGYGHDADEDLERACREALHRYDRSLKESR